jgi:hypothetical protein
MPPTRLLVVLVFAGCPGRPPADPVHTPAGPGPCERMADHLVGLMQPVDPATGQAIERDRDTADLIARTLITRCTEDRWTLDAQRCFLGLASIPEADRCAPLLTVEQRDAMDAAMEQALGPRPDGGG